MHSKSTSISHENRLGKELGVNPEVILSASLAPSARQQSLAHARRGDLSGWMIVSKVFPESPRHEIADRGNAD